MSRTVAIGDYNNDVSMIKAAGVGIAVANAVEEAKAAADRITVSNEESAIAKVIEEIERGEIII
jgi:hydroxymethylpyrimidine pyrophosphatase-like HAD family hydrolase